MNVTDAIFRNVIDAGIGFVNFQQVELENIYGRDEVVFLRLDQLAGLGCCCFCSIQYIVPNRMLNEQPERVAGFLKATQRGAAFVTERPEEAFEVLCQSKPNLRNNLFEKIFYRSLPFFSRSLLNVERDWAKVNRYMRHLNLVDKSFDIEACYTNAHLPAQPYCELSPIACCL